MADTALGVGTGTGTRPAFFLWMAVVMAAVVFGGFGLSYFVPMATGSLAPLAPIVHVHGVVYFAWLILLVTQAMLINRGSLALHRSMGLLGIAIGTGLVILGSLVTALFARKAIAMSDPTIYGVTYISLLAVFGFSVLFWLAIRSTSEPAAHKRYILLATTVFLIGGLNRIYLFLFGVGFETNLTYLPKYLTVDLLIAALVWYDWRTLGAIHRATWIGGAVNVIPQLLHVPVVGSDAFVGLTHWIAGLAYY